MGPSLYRFLWLLGNEAPNKTYKDLILANITEEFGEHAGSVANSADIIYISRSSIHIDKEFARMISFKWCHFKKAIILMAVRWYLAYALSYRNSEELMLERGVEVDHSTIHRWVVKYAPLLESEFRRNHKSLVGRSWRMDETYLKVKGKWVYLYRAVDKEGNTIDFMLSKTRDKKAAKAFFEKAIESSGLPGKITIDKSGSNKSALNSMNLFLSLFSVLCGISFKILIRDIKYLNNIVEQDHRGIKRMTHPMMGFKSFESAEATLAGIELHHILKKGQHKNAANQSLFEQFYELAA